MLTVRPGAACTAEVASDGQTVFTIAGEQAGQASLRLTALSQAGIGGADDPYVAVFQTKACCVGSAGQGATPPRRRRLTNVT